MLLPHAKSIRAGSHSGSIRPPARPPVLYALYLYPPCILPNRHSLQLAQNPPRSDAPTLRRGILSSLHPVAKILRRSSLRSQLLASLTGEGPFLGSVWRIHLWTTQKISHIFPLHLRKIHMHKSTKAEKDTGGQGIARSMRRRGIALWTAGEGRR